MLPPLVERELRVALLRRKARKQWLRAAWITGAITLGFLALQGLTVNRLVGRTLFQLLFALGIAGILTRGFGLTADLFSEERRNGTLGLVVLTGLRPYEIFASKLLGALLLTAFALLGGLPFFAIPFLAGGVPASQFLCGLAFLANGLLFCVAVGLLASVLHRDGGQAQVTAQATAAGICLVPPLLHWLAALAGRPTAVPAQWLYFSPGYPAYLVFGRFAKGASGLFWMGSAVTLSYSVAMLLLAGLILQRTWRDGPETVVAGSGRLRWRAWTKGSRRWRDRLRARFLADQPFCWLAARDRAPVLLGYGLLVLAASIWLAGWAAAGATWLSPSHAFISSILLHQALNLAGAYAAGRRFAEERVSGGFELLLTTRLKAAELVEGQGRAVLVQFRGVALGALMLDILFCWNGLRTLKPATSGTLLYLLGWVLMLSFWFAMHLASASRAMWISTWTGRPAYAALKAGGSYWFLLFWLWFVWRAGGSVSLLFNSYKPVLFFLVLLFPILLTFSTRFVLRRKLSRELRLIATAPIPARGDSRFKKWDPEKIFPPDPCGGLPPTPAGKRVAKKRQPRGRMDTRNG